MVGLGTLGLLMGAGWLATRGLEGRALVRFLLAWALGFSLWGAWSLVVGWFVSFAPAVALGGGLFACLWSWRKPGFEGESRRHKFHPLLLSLALALMLVGWLHSVGGVQLKPSQELLLFDLPKIAQMAAGKTESSHPLGTASDSAVSPAAPLAAAWGAEPLRPLLVLGGLAQAGAVGLWLWLGVRQQPRAPLATALGGLALFWGTPKGWLLATSPWTGLAYLLALSFFVLTSTRGVARAAPCLVALSRLSPSLTLACALFALGRMAKPRAWLVLVGAALSLSFHGASWGVLIAVYLAWRNPKLHIRALSLASLAYPGGLEWAALGLAVGRVLTALWLRTPRRGWSVRREPLVLEIPGRFLLALMALLCLWRSLVGGEEVFNDDILIRSQKEKASLARLLIPHRLSDWVSWRGSVVGFAPEDLAALSSFGEGHLVLYQTGEPEESLEVPALLSALAGGRSLAGWHASKRGVSPMPAVAAYFLTGDAELLRATPVRRVLRRGDGELLIEPWPEGSSSGQAATIVPTRMEKWGKLLWYHSDGSTGYQVELDGQPFGEDYAVRVERGQEIPYVPPRLSGEVTLVWSHGASETPPTWPLLAELKVSPEVPSRSLLTVDLELENPSSLRLELSDLRGLRWSLDRLLSTRPDEVSPLVPLEPLVLEANSLKTLSVSFRTPPEMGTYEVALEFVDALGQAHPVAFRSPLTLRTWRRHPLVAVPEGVVRVSP